MHRLILALALLWSWSASAGTNGGNGFFDRVNAVYEFRVTLPSEWSCDGCDGSRESKLELAPASPANSAWMISVPGHKTSLRVSFIGDDPALSLEDLYSELTQQYPKISWYNLNRHQLVGWSSADKNANSAVECYFVTAHRTIRLEWQKDGSEPELARELDTILDSISRVPATPRIESIESDQQSAYRVGDKACLIITAVDPAGRLGERSLESMDIEGMLPHWRFFDMKWESSDPTRARYSMCFRVTSHFGPHGLRITNLVLHPTRDDDDDDASRDLTCTPTDDHSEELSCASEDTPDAPGKKSVVVPKVASVDNPEPAVAGPQIHGLKVDSKNGLTVTLDAEAQSGLYLAIISIPPFSTYLFADDLKAKRPVSIAAMAHSGWNTIASVQVFDRNGVPTVLRLPPAKGKERGGEHLDVYEVVPWKGPVQPSSIKINTFLNGGAYR